MSTPDGPWTVRKTLEWTSSFFTRKGVDAPRLSAELLLAHVLDLPRIRLYTDYERILTDPQRAALRELVTRAAEHEPIAYLTSRAHFFNLEFAVTRDTLIPRPDTETLVENVVQVLKRQLALEHPRILDLCTGTGCIAAAIAHHVKNAIVIATEINQETASVARQNIERLGLSGRVTIEEGDLFDPITQLVDPQPFDIIVANPPYIPSANIASLDRSVRDYEPVRALDGGPDGLDFHRKILTQAPARLTDTGLLFMEIQFDQAEQAKQIATDCATWTDIRVLKDHAGHDRVLAAKKKQ